MIFLFFNLIFLHPGQSVDSASPFLLFSSLPFPFFHSFLYLFIFEFQFKAQKTNGNPRIWPVPALTEP